MNYEQRRDRVYAEMRDHSVLLLWSGIELHTGADAYHDFEANRNFFYLTGLRRDHMVLLMRKNGEKKQTTLYIEEADPASERWTGKMVTADEAKEITGIRDIRYMDRFERELNQMLTSTDVEEVCADCYRHTAEHIPDYNTQKASEIAAGYPGIRIRNIWPVLAKLRMEKDPDEQAVLSEAIEVTDQALRHVMKVLKPGMKEYQAQAAFEFSVKNQGAEGMSFPTIAGSGKNGCMLHYETNRDTCEDGSLLLMDLGARVNGYNADITRTYPVNGRFTERQRSVYEIVLEANRAVAAAAKPGMSLRDLNDLCRQVLADGCIRLGLIRDADELRKYYMHSVSHHLGIDVHDVTAEGSVLTPGCVITDEPGLYIDEWETGIRIEDDLLITEDGCRVLSASVIRDPDEIEAFMADR